MRLLKTRFVLILTLLGFWGTGLAAQERPRELLETPFGLKLDFRPEGAWRKKAMEVARARRSLLSSGNLFQLNSAVEAGVPFPSQTAVSGRLNVPVVLFRFRNVGTGERTVQASEIQEILFGTIPTQGRPYTLRTFYQELSNGLLEIDGSSVDWVTLPGTELAYTGIPGSCPFGPAGNCNGVFSAEAVIDMTRGLRQALDLVDSLTDFSLFDNDGPDGVPNSGDDDGIVDFVLFLQSERDGACGGGGNNHIWSHRSVISYTTDDISASGGSVRIADYTIQSAVGGGMGCDSTLAMPIGTTAHEAGHAFGLPDLYDTGGATEGIGQWGLMGSGNWASQFSPAHMSAWSLATLGWVSVAEPVPGSTNRISPVELSDSVYLVRFAEPNPAGEYLLLENRRSLQSDTALISNQCSRGGVPALPCTGGLLIWHVDSALVENNLLTNTVNAGNVQGVVLIEADGQGNLTGGLGPRNRGDGGDPWPGTRAVSRLGHWTMPGLARNVDGSFTGFGLSAIAEDAPGGTVSFELLSGRPTVVMNSEPTGTVRVGERWWNRTEDLLATGDTVGVSVDSVQGNGDTRLEFRSWSDAGTRDHLIFGTRPPDTLVATMATVHRIEVETFGLGNGEIISNPPLDLRRRAFVDEGRTVTLRAVPLDGAVFAGWVGDMTAASETLAFQVTAPVVVTAVLHQEPGPMTELGFAILGAGYEIVLPGAGSRSINWVLQAGELPQGLKIQGVTLRGIPRDAGAFPFTARVSSGTLFEDTQFGISVINPQIAAERMVQQLLGIVRSLTIVERRFLDSEGNRNGRFDVGDFARFLISQQPERFRGTENAAASRRNGGGR